MTINREFTMLNIKRTSLYFAFSLAIVLVGCSGNDSNTVVGSIEKIELEPVDKTLEAEAWTVENYTSIGALGYQSLVDNLNIRSAFLGYEKNLAILLNLFSTQGTFSCDIGNLVVSQEDASTRVVYNDCQLGGTLYVGEIWTNLMIACDENVVSDTFIMGYKDYRQRQKLGDSASYSQMYANGEYQFISRSELDTEEVAVDNTCPKKESLDSKVVLLPQEFVQIEEDDSETTIDNASFELQSDTHYVEYKNLELSESVANPLSFSIAGSISMNSLGNDIEIVGSDFKYGLDGKTKSGLLRLIDGDSEISLSFSSESVIITLDLDTTTGVADVTETIAQENF